MSKINARPFRLALCQLGGTGSDKKVNIELARKAVAQAAASTPKPELIVLPEIWNSPYAVSSFREYSEVIPAVGSEGANGEEEEETVKAMREMARSAGTWLIGGEWGSTEFRELEIIDGSRCTRTAWTVDDQARVSS